MTTKSSFFLAILFIANPFMLLFFQNCSAQNRNLASNEAPQVQNEPDLTLRINKNLKVK